MYDKSSARSDGEILQFLNFNSRTKLPNFLQKQRIDPNKGMFSNEMSMKLICLIVLDDLSR